MIFESTCTKCGVVKSSLEFSPNPRKKNGITSWCKACTLLKVKENYGKPRDPNKIVARKKKHIDLCNKIMEACE